MTFVDIISIGWVGLALMFLAAQASSDAAIQKKNNEKVGWRHFIMGSIYGQPGGRERRFPEINYNLLIKIIKPPPH